MDGLTRRQFVAATGIGLYSLGQARGITPWERPAPRIKGLSLATYSLKRHMKWWKGKPAQGDLDMFAFLEQCAVWGFDAAELTAYFFDAPVEITTLRQLKRRAHLLGLDVSGGAIGNDFGHPPASAHSTRELEYTKRWIDHYAELGAPAVRVFAGRSRPDGATDEQVIENVIANFEQVLPYAEQRGVMLGLENHDFASNLDHLLAIVRRVDSDWFGVTWDSANIAPTDDPYRELARIAPYAITAQVKVTTRIQDQAVQADYVRLIEILRAASFRGYLVLEYEEAQEPFEQIPKFAAEVRKAIRKTEAS